MPQIITEKNKWNELADALALFMQQQRAMKERKEDREWKKQQRELERERIESERENRRAQQQYREAQAAKLREEDQRRDLREKRDQDYAGMSWSQEMNPGDVGPRPPDDLRPFNTKKAEAGEQIFRERLASDRTMAPETAQALREELTMPGDAVAKLRAEREARKEAAKKAEHDNKRAEGIADYETKLKISKKYKEPSEPKPKKLSTDDQLLVDQVKKQQAIVDKIESKLKEAAYDIQSRNGDMSKNSEYQKGAALYGREKQRLANLRAQMRAKGISDEPEAIHNPTEEAAEGDLSSMSDDELMAMRERLGAKP